MARDRQRGSLAFVSLQHSAAAAPLALILVLLPLLLLLNCVAAAHGAGLPQQAATAPGEIRCAHDAIVPQRVGGRSVVVPQQVQVQSTRPDGSVTLATTTMTPAALSRSGSSGSDDDDSAVQPRIVITWGSLRISFDYSKLGLNTDNPNACYSAGSVVRVGNPSGANTPACVEGSVESDCWYTCGASDVVTQGLVDFIQSNLVPAAESFLERALQVQRVTGNLVLAAGTCGAQGGVTVPTSYTTTGVANADLLVFVTARPTFSNVAAWALECQTDQYNRPIAGHINFGPRYTSASAVFQTQLATAVHELTHVLGFSSSKYGEYVDPNNNNAVLPVSQVKASRTATGANSATYTVQEIITPGVVTWVRAHFNCSTLTGGQLEDGGGSGTVLSHWEKKLFWNEYMVGVVDPRPVLSSLTLAFLQDMGYYRANTSVAEPLLWGYGKGCAFYTGPCMGAAWTSPYSCDTSGYEECNFDRTAKSYCGVTTYNSALPTYFQYFSGQPTRGGPSSVTDYCTMYLPYSNGYCDTPSNAINPTQTGETFAAGSRCLMSSLVQTGLSLTGQSPRPGCFNVSCNAFGQIVVRVGSQSQTCPLAGGTTLTFSGFSGSVVCPPAAEICSAVASLQQATVAAVTPAIGTDRGGQRVTIAGTGFSSATAVRIGEVACSSLVVDSATQMRCTTGPKLGTNALVAVEVTTVAGVVSVPALYTYSTLAPYLTSVSPSSGYSYGLTVITLQGGNLATVAGTFNVQVGGKTCTLPTIVTNGTAVSCRTPSGTVGLSVDVMYCQTSGDNLCATKTSSFTYVSSSSGWWSNAGSTAQPLSILALMLVLLLSIALPLTAAV